MTYFASVGTYDKREKEQKLSQEEEQENSIFKKVRVFAKCLRIG